MSLGNVIVPNPAHRNEEGPKHSQAVIQAVHKFRATAVGFDEGKLSGAKSIALCNLACYIGELVIREVEAAERETPDA